MTHGRILLLTVLCCLAVAAPLTAAPRPPLKPAERAALAAFARKTLAG